MSHCFALSTAAFFLFCSCVVGQNSLPSNVIEFDASRAGTPAAPSVVAMGPARNPNGQSLGMNERYLTLNGQPWLPVMGEFHFSRYPRSEWETELLKMKAGGVQIVSTYLIWIHHEEVQGTFDWSDQRDVRYFVELCQKHGLFVWIRLGPWTHGEVRNGGLPDWLLKKSSKLRTNDPEYLSYVNVWFHQIGKQLSGLTWKNGGPIIGAQLENEYSQVGPNAGAAHILRLKEMAIASGLEVPLYSVTGWDNATIPSGEVVAVFGGYPDAPWDSSLDELPPGEVYRFRFGSRVSSDMGAIGSHDRQTIASYGFPFMTAEMGGGVEVTYHRRPRLRADDVAAMVPVSLGSGANLYGSYMFHGGRNPEGKNSTLQESQETGYPNDLPIKSYDFQAPLSEFGEEREVFRKLKVFNYFLSDFGNLLAPMEIVRPNVLPADGRDKSVPRVSVRSDGKSGFVFFNNFIRNYQTPIHRNFQVRIKLSDRQITIPDKPIDLRSGAYGIWPFNLKLGLLRLRYSTAQLVSRVESKASNTYYFEAIPGIEPQFSFEKSAQIRITTTGRETLTGEDILITAIKPSLEAAVSGESPNGQKTEIILLDAHDAENGWKLNCGSSRMLFTESQYYSDKCSVTLQQDASPHAEIDVVPAISRPVADAVKLVEMKAPASISKFALAVSAVDPKMSIDKIADAKPVNAVKLGPAFSWRKTGVAKAPSDADFAASASWQIKVPQSSWSGVCNLFLQVDYDGDVARLVANGKLLDDNFYNGAPWRIGLKSLSSAAKEQRFELEILPRRADAPIFLERYLEDPKFTSGQRVNLKSIRLVPQYSMNLQFKPD